MEKQRQIKILAIVALMLAVAGMSLGFAAFSTTLNISSSASVNPNNEDFKVRFCNNTTLGSCADDSKVYASDFTVFGGASNVVADISGLTGNFETSFTKPGQRITYKFYVHNLGEYDAYLRSAYFENLENGTYKKCTATTTDSTKATDSLVQAACEGIMIEVVVRGANYESGARNIQNHLLAKNAYEDVLVKINYRSDASYVDGPFKVEIGNLKFDYSTVNTEYIYFSVLGTSYQAVAGMTWQDWFNSNFYSNEFTTSERGNIMYGGWDMFVMKNGSCNGSVLLTDTIISDAEYSSFC